jgi:hypothetical protein
LDIKSNHRQEFSLTASACHPERRFGAKDLGEAICLLFGRVVKLRICVSCSGKLAMIFELGAHRAKHAGEGAETHIDVLNDLCDPASVDSKAFREVLLGDLQRLA